MNAARVPGGGVSGQQSGSSVIITVTNGAKHVYVDWPDGTFTDHSVPPSGKVVIPVPDEIPSGFVTVTDMNIPDPADDVFPIS